MGDNKFVLHIYLLRTAYSNLPDCNLLTFL